MAGGKIVLQGTIELLSPALIGSGRGDHTDVDVLLDRDGKPFIPATSLVGVLKHFIQLDTADENNQKRFWGFTSEEKISDKEKEKPSDLCCSDLTFLDGNDKPIVRDGIRVNNKNGIVAKGAKYDYQVIERGAKFKLNLEVNLTDTNRTFARQMVATIRNGLELGLIQIGAKTNSGLGKMKLTNVQVYEFNFSDKKDVLRWFKRDYSTPNPFSESHFEIQGNIFSIDATFRLKNSFICRSYSADPNATDAVSIKSGSDFVLTGTSLKGAIRSRAERILRTLGKSEERTKEMLSPLFGNVDTEDTEKMENGKEKVKAQKENRARKGRISVDETLLSGFEAEQQTRIKIDRFTGGTIESALFDTMPLFTDISKDNQIKHVRITIRDYADCEAGLMLLVLKDLWTGDLAIGGEKGVGRGVFEGIQTDIRWNNEKAKLHEHNGEFSIEGDKSILEGFITVLKNR